MLSHRPLLQPLYARRERATSSACGLPRPAWARRRPCPSHRACPSHPVCRRPAWTSGRAAQAWSPAGPEAGPNSVAQRPDEARPALRSEQARAWPLAPVALLPGAAGAARGVGAAARGWSDRCDADPEGWRGWRNLRRDGPRLGLASRRRRWCSRLSARLLGDTRPGLAALIRRLRRWCPGRGLRLRIGRRYRDLRRRRRWCCSLSARLLGDTLSRLAALIRSLRRRCPGRGSRLRVGRRDRNLRRWRRWCCSLSARLLGDALPRLAAGVGRLRIGLHWRRAHRRRCLLLLRDHPDGRCGRGCGRFQLPARGVVERLAGLGRELRLLRSEAGRCGRRRGAGDDGPLERTGRRRAARTGRAAHAALGRCDRRDDRDRRAGDGILPDADHRPGHRLRLCEHGGRDGDDGSRHLPIGVHHVGHVGVVVVVVDDGRVDDRVAAIDVLEVAAAHRIGRPEHLARPEREPRDAADAAAGDRQLEVVSAHERDQCRCVVGACLDGAGYPAPSAANARPAAVVGNGEAPGRVVDPCPAPRIHPRPMPVAVRRPAGRHLIREPDVAVGRVDAPGAVGIEILVADHVLRDVASGGRHVVAAVPVARPAIEFVGTKLVDIPVVAQVGPRESIRLP